MWSHLAHVFDLCLVHPPVCLLVGGSGWDEVTLVAGQNEYQLLLPRRPVQSNILNPPVELKTSRMENFTKRSIQVNKKCERIIMAQFYDVYKEKSVSYDSIKRVFLNSNSNKRERGKEPKY